MSSTEEQPTGQGSPIVLAVDDEANVLAALKRSMRRWPWTVLTAEGGAQGLEILRQHPVAVVISDYQMPEMNGIEFLNEVRKSWPEIQRVMLTGNADLSMIEHLVNQSEVSRFLTKPWSDSQLKATLSECIERVHLTQSNQRFERELAERNKDLEQLNKQLERLVEERTQALVQAEKLAWLGRMAGGVAHEINNPLGGILAFVQLLQRAGVAEGSNKEAVEAIYSCAIRCKTIIDDLLSFARRPVLAEMEEIQMNTLLEKSWNIARLNPQLHDRALRFDLADELPLVAGQSSLIQQVVINLLQNAFQASHDDKAVVLRSRLDGSWVLVEVEDEGTGIPPDVLPQIFEPFFTTKEVGQGTGLGLAICYGIVQEHGGKLAVKSELGQGTMFSLRLKARGRGEGGPA
ncbi:MAG: response regulator [Deltaproteobacteria bacterium]|nr:response regulator [Deltaproteobacteria bacterium]